MQGVPNLPRAGKGPWTVVLPQKGGVCKELLGGVAHRKVWGHPPIFVGTATCLADQLG